jgi:hypothetical protein
VLNLTGANAKGKSTKGTVGGCMAVTAHHRRAGESESLLGTNNMDNALPLVIQAEVCDTEIPDILLEGYTLCPRIVLLDEAGNVFQGLP